METQTIVLPESALDTVIKITDIDGDSETKPIIVMGSNGALIEGNESFTINTNFDSVEFKFDGTQWSRINL